MIQQFLKWLVYKLGLKPLIGFFLILLAVGSATYAFTDAIRTLSFGSVFPLVTLSLISSWLLAQTKVRGWLASILLILLGIVFTFIRIGELGSPLITLARSFFNSLWQILNLKPGEVADFSILSLAFSEVAFGVRNLVAALWDWIQSLLDGLPLINELAIITLWSFLLWLLASWAGWWLRRQARPLIALLPVGVVAAAILGYSWSDTFVLGPMMFSVLLLFAYVNFDQSEETWKSIKMDYPEDLPKEFSATIVAIVFGIVLVALVLPSFPIRGIIRFVSDFTAPQIENAEPVIESFGLVQSTIPKGDIGKALQGGLPRFHLIGSGPELSEQIVMTVRISGGISGDQDTSLALPLYWRSLAYNEYFGIGWRSSDVIIRTYDPGEEVIRTDSPYHQEIQQEFRIAQGATQYLFAAGDIITADDDFRIAYRPTLRYTELFDAHGDFFGASIDQNSYRVQSFIPVVSEEILRKSQGEYPSWVMENYLPLPDTIPNRVFELAESLTKEDETTYDKVRSLERYLRGFEYTLDVELPPIRSDLVDYFLFDLQKGYCDYYASAMVVMARGMGIPSRIATGYVRGSFDSLNNRYIVSEADAHSWVEVYFPGIGWIPFEPTAGRDPITRFETEEQVAQDRENARNLDVLIPWYERFDLDLDWPLIVLIIGIIFSLAGMGIFVFDTYRLRNMTTPDLINHLFQRLYRHGRILGVLTQKEVTPIEFSERLVDLLIGLSSASRFTGRFLETAVQVKTFTDIYTVSRYSKRSHTIKDRKELKKLWHKLRFRLILARVYQLFTRSHPQDHLSSGPDLLKS